MCVHVDVLGTHTQKFEWIFIFVAHSEPFTVANTVETTCASARARTPKKNVLNTHPKFRCTRTVYLFACCIFIRLGAEPGIYLRRDTRYALAHIEIQEAAAAAAGRSVALSGPAVRARTYGNRRRVAIYRPGPAGQRACVHAYARPARPRSAKRLSIKHRAHIISVHCVCMCVDTYY